MLKNKFNVVLIATFAIVLVVEICMCVSWIGPNIASEHRLLPAIEERISSVEANTTLDNESKQKKLDYLKSDFESMKGNINKSYKYLVCFAIIDIAFVGLIIFRLRKIRKKE